MTASLPDLYGINTLPVTYKLDGLVMGGRDAAGNLWVPQKTEGWHNPPPARGERTKRPFAHGSFRSVSYRDEREITIEGVVICGDVLARNRARDKFSALCSDPGRLYPLVVDDQSETSRTALVELSGTPKFALVNERRADYQLTLVAPDPRKHDFFWQSPQALLGQDTAAGLDASGSGLDASGGGLDAGTPTAPSAATVVNYGTAPCSPVFVLYGPMQTPTVRHRGSGRAITYAAALDVGEVLVVNADDFAVHGPDTLTAPGHSCISTVRGNVRSLLTLDVDWPVIEPGQAATFELLSPGGDPGAALTVLTRSAYW